MSLPQAATVVMVWRKYHSLPSKYQLKDNHPSENKWLKNPLHRQFYSYGYHPPDGRHSIFSEGIQKFLFADKLGAGPFAKIYLPNPDFLGSFVGGFEIVCGTLVLLGFFTRLAAIPLLTITLVAIPTTKTQILAENGFWSMLHNCRTDWTILLGSIFLLIKSGGRWSLAYKILYKV